MASAEGRTGIAKINVQIPENRNAIAMIETVMKMEKIMIIMLKIMDNTVAATGIQRNEVRITSNQNVVEYFFFSVCGDWV